MNGKMNINAVHSSSSSLSSASESNVAQDVIEALEEDGFESIKKIGKSGEIAMIYLIMWS